MTEVVGITTPDVVPIRLYIRINQAAAVIAVILALSYRLVWAHTDDLWAEVVAGTLLGVTLEIASRSLRPDRLLTVGAVLLVANWMHAIALAWAVPFAMPVALLEVLVPMLAAGPVLHARGLRLVLAGAVATMAAVATIGHVRADAGVVGALPGTVTALSLVGGVVAITIPLALVTWDIHVRQRRALEHALAANVEMRRSRRRLVTVADRERRRIERDLHDGAQQHFAAVAMRLRLLRSRLGPAAGTGGPPRASVSGEVGDALVDLEAGLDALRDLAHGIYPPLLRARGLAAALTEVARRSPSPVSVTSTGPAGSGPAGGRPRPEIEAVAYYVCLEALANATKHAGESPTIGIEVALTASDVTVTVTDDGPGFDRAGHPPDDDAGGHGLRNMADRVGSVGGVLEITSTPGTGVTVRAVLPT